MKLSELLKVVGDYESVVIWGNYNEEDGSAEFLFSGNVGELNFRKYEEIKDLKIHHLTTGNYQLTINCK